MHYKEENLIKLLEYGKMPASDIYESIAQTLGLEFYVEPSGPVYTICSNTFVLDISSASCSLIFVEDAHNSQFFHVQQYLNAYFSDKAVFYRLLKFFIKTVDLEEQKATVDGTAYAASCGLDRHKNVCECVFTGKYCIAQPLGAIPEGYNIFTHRSEYTHFSPLLSLPVDSSATVDLFVDGRRAGLRPNLYAYFTPEAFSLHAIAQLPVSSEYFYEGDGIKVQGRNVYVNGAKCRIASFIFKKGCSLRDALELGKSSDPC